jgi:RNA polymerase sigma-70 factor (ECF subfamily)
MAWDDFYRIYWPLIHSCARGRGCSDATAEDIVQDVIMRVFEQKDIFRYDPERGRFRDWLGALVRSKVAEHRRRPSARAKPLGGESSPSGSFSGDGSGSIPEPEATDPSPDEAWERAFESQLLLALLDVVRREVNPRDYLAFELLELRGLSGSDAARITGTTRNAAFKARRRVLRKLEALAGGYEAAGVLQERVKEALRLRPAPSLERAMSTRMEKTFRTRWEAHARDR